MYNEDVLNSSTIEGMLAAPGIKWHRDPPDVIGMWLADPDFPTAPMIKKALINAVQDEDLLYNTDDKARAAMAERVNKKNGFKTHQGRHLRHAGRHPSDVALHPEQRREAR